MSKILTVVGATGAQGGSVVTSALKSGVALIRVSSEKVIARKKSEYSNCHKS
ncbi:NAD(P)-binding domain [Penicillium roqueforti FM164]|uniref:NAD(P)-binding domain n=1 Tax=Penicillium roqueforti (strain FM164) TaxID=1365484 RepID=W6QNL8_PENRF|nr:NAD(P)-binding domain [Penicillium roqueforti FM164]